jgi:hypothetical protein
MTLPQTTASSPHADRAEADDGADDRVRGGDGKAESRCHQQQGRGGRQGSEHPVEQELGVRRHHVRREDALAHRIGDVAADEEGPTEL